MKKPNNLLLILVMTILLNTTIKSPVLAAETQPEESSWTEFFSELVSFLSGEQGDTGLVSFLKIFYQSINGEMPEEGKKASEAENNLEDAYAIKEDIADRQQILGAQTILEQQTLGEDAQTLTKEALDNSNRATQESEELGEESQNLDVSQQILQNISGQLSQQAKLDNLLMRQTVLSRQDLAVNGVLAAQTAKQLNELNTTQRQEKIATVNRTLIHGGMLTVPGTALLNSDE
jgi:cell division inhibitor SulA